VLNVKRLSTKFEGFTLDFWICPDLMRDVGIKRIDEINETLVTFLDQLDRQEEQYLQLYLEKIKMPRIAVLMAHGTLVGPRIFDGWWYTTAGEDYAVQDWIDKREAEDYGALTIMSCNVAAQTPRSSKALLILPDRPFSLPALECGEICVNLIHPRKGELQHIIEHELRALRVTKMSAPS